MLRKARPTRAEQETVEDSGHAPAEPPQLAAVAETSNKRTSTGEWPVEAVGTALRRVPAPTRPEPRETPAPQRSWNLLGWAAGLVLLASLGWLARLPLLEPLLPFPARWNFLGRDPAFQRASGFVVLGLSALGLLLPLRRRLGKRAPGRRESWRVAHVLLGVALCLGLLLHTSARLGHGSNLVLSIAMLSVLGVGTVLGLAWRPRPPQPRILGRKVRPLHVLLLWPTVGLIAVHVLIVYYF